MNEMNLRIEKGKESTIKNRMGKTGVGKKRKEKQI